MEIYDIAVIGAGPAGCMAAIQASKWGKDVVLIERNDSIGHKLLLTANGRCNITNTANLDVFLEKFGKQGSFYRDAFNKFSNQDLMNFFKNQNLELKEEDEGRVFPVTDKAKSVVDVLKTVLEENNVKILFNFRMKHLYKQSKIFKIHSNKNQIHSHKDHIITASKVIITTGGVTYKYTGSTGDGLDIAKLLGHHITEIKPGGVPLTVRENWVHRLKGVTLENVGMNIQYGGRFKTLPRGNLLFTHFGISGPIILDMSNAIVEMMDKHGELKLNIDFKPNIKANILEIQLIEDFQNDSKKSLKTYLKNHLPHSTIEPILNTFSLDPQKKLNQITKKERVVVQNILKSLPLTITGHLPLDTAMVTCGGVSKKQIDPKTMESKLVNGLYFAGEIIDGCGRRGGYNLQQAFSTGYVAGQSAALIE